MAGDGTLNAAIGRNLRALRDARGMPRERLALALEMSSENVRNYETGKQKLTVPMLPTIAELYGMTVPELISDLFDPRSDPNTTDTSGYENSVDSSANYNYTESLRRDFVRCAVGGPSRRMLVPALV